MYCRMLLSNGINDTAFVCFIVYAYDPERRGEDKNTNIASMSFTGIVEQKQWRTSDRCQHVRSTASVSRQWLKHHKLVHKPHIRQYSKTLAREPVRSRLWLLFVGVGVLTVLWLDGSHSQESYSVACTVVSSVRGTLPVLSGHIILR